MKVSDLFRQLSYGELSNLSLSGSGSGQIQTAQQPKIILATNNALTALHTRFVLKESELVVEQIENLTSYPMEVQYAESSGSDAPYHFIKDALIEPFKGDLLKILSVWHSSGRVYRLNDAGFADSLYTPQPHILQIPYPVGGQDISVVYQANHYELSSEIEGEGAEGFLDQEIHLPIFLNNALKLYIAYQIFSNMNGQENILKGQEFLSAYEAKCLEIQHSDLANQSSHTTHSKLEQRGFV